MITEDCAVQHSSQAYHRGETVGVSVEREGYGDSSRDENGHRSVTGARGKRGH